jgi:NADH dehydrogenase
MIKPARAVIVGGGFGGLEAAKILARFPDLIDVTIIDRRNHHLFQPLLYQVSMAGLSPADIAYPIRSILTNKRNIRVLLGEALDIDKPGKMVKCDFGIVPYDYLILACGANHSYFGHNEWEPYAPGLKTLEQATEIRRRVLTAFELAERETSIEKRRQLLTFVVVGGGPTGVEISGSLGEITRYTLGRDFKNIDPGSTRVILIEAGPRILPSFDLDLSKKAVRDLENLGVAIWTSTRVTRIDDSGVHLGQELIQTNSVIWAAGVKPSPINAKLSTPLDAAGRLIVERDLSLPEWRNVFAVGDQIHFKDKHGNTLPGQAPAAMQGGRHAARNILLRVRGKESLPFVFFDKGQMATIGRRKAVLQFKGIKLSGTIAWWAWLFVHIYYLIGFKNRFVVLFQWAISYWTWGRGARLVTNANWRTDQG